MDLNRNYGFIYIYNDDKSHHCSQLFGLALYKTRKEMVRESLNKKYVLHGFSNDNCHGNCSQLSGLALYKTRKEMVRESLKTLLAGCLLLLFLASCSTGGRNGKLPKSTGQPYEVVLEGDTDSIVTKILTEEVPALPQPEPLCRLIQVKKGKTHGSYLLVRTRIVVNIPAAEFSVRLSRNENASPQTVIRISARSLQQLREKLNPEKLRQLVDETELEHLASIISTNPSKQNREMQQLVKKNFGISMNIPAEMQASKKAKNFIWISNNASSGMKNLILMKVKREERRGKANSDAFPAQEKQQIDSMLRTNMPGETDSMYMIIPVLSEKGLWEMKGDAMGGPYVMRRIRLRKTGDEIIIIGFVYAPEMKKKILIKQLEAAISTIK